MLRRIRAARLAPRAGKAGRQLFRAAGLVVACLLIAGLGNCGFPQYGFPGAPASGTSGLAGLGPVAGGGTVGRGGAAGAGAAAGKGGDAGSYGGRAGAGAGGANEAGDAGQGGAAGQGGDGGWAGGGHCAFPEPLLFPLHCFNKSLDTGETGVDCGGSDCAACTRNDPCIRDSDCASGQCTPAKTCAQILGVQYSTGVSVPMTRTPKFDLTISQLASTPTKLQDLRIRYYFNHNGVAEPVIALDSQARWNNLDITTSVRAIVYRTPLGPLENLTQTDSYVEVSFVSNLQLSANDVLTVVQDVVAGNGDALFQQASHYSFLNSNGPIQNDAITIYRGSQRLWGVEPPIVQVPDCAFVGGVNVGGAAVTVDGVLLSAEGDASLTFQGGTTSANSAAKPLPVTTQGATTLLTTWRTLSGTNSAVWTVPNGKYWAYAWLTSAASTDVGTLLLQGNPTDTFVGLQQVGVGSGWALLGPYPVEVLDGKLRLSVMAGTVHLAGLKLYSSQ